MRISDYVFGALFAGLCILFALVQLPNKGLEDTLFLLLQIFGARAFLAVGFLKKDHIPAIKALLFNVAFPFIIFKSVADSNRDQIPTYASLSGIAFLHDVFALIVVGAILWAFSEVKTISTAQAIGVVFSMSAVATMSTGMPFAIMLGGDAVTKLVFCDQGNKFWILVIVYIMVVVIFSKSVNSKAEMARSIARSIVTNPLILGFVAGIICLATETNTKKMLLTGKMARDFAGMTNNLTMVFIGMKLEFPEDPTCFVPICARRAAGMFFVALIVSALRLPQETFRVLIIYVSAGSSLFPYVYFLNVAPDDERVDTEFLFQTVTYDYFSAIVVNSVIAQGVVPNCSIAALVGVGFLVAAVGLGALTRALKERNNKAGAAEPLPPPPYTDAAEMTTPHLGAACGTEGPKPSAPAALL